jgi:hypothetical protein
LIISGAERVLEGAEDRGFGGKRFAAGRVEGEVGAIDEDAQVAQAQRDPLEDVGDRV